MADINGKKVTMIHFGSPVGSEWKKAKSHDKKKKKEETRLEVKNES